MRDPYKVLGVKPEAGQDEIKAAWRSRAKAVHPDHNQQDPMAAARFAEVGQAYDTLKDPQKRDKYDTLSRMAQGTGNAKGQTIMQQRQAAQEAAKRAKEAQANAARVMEELARANARKAAAAATKDAASNSAEKPAAQKSETAEEVVERIFGARVPPESSGASAKPADTARKAADDAEANAAGEAAAQEEIMDADEVVENVVAGRASFGIFSSIMRRFKGAATAPQEKVPDIAAEATISVDDILKSAWIPVQLSDGREVRFQAHAGIANGQIVSLKGQGLKLQGMQRGDVAITVHVTDHDRFVVKGLDVHAVVPVTIEDAVLGCRKSIDGPAGRIEIEVPAWSGSDHVIRVPGAGLSDGIGTKGDFVAELRLMLWEKPDDKVTDLMRSMKNGLVL